MNPGTQESELPVLGGGASPQPVTRWHFRNHLQCSFSAGSHHTRGQSHRFTSLGSREIYPGGRKPVLRQIPGQGRDWERKNDLWQGIGTSQWCPLSSKAPSGAPSWRTASPLPQDRCLSPMWCPHVPICLQVSCLPCFSLVFVPPPPNSPPSVGPSLLRHYSRHSLIDNHSTPWVVSLLLPCLHPFLLHVTRPVLHFGPLLKSSRISQLLWIKSQFLSLVYKTIQLFGLCLPLATSKNYPYEIII